MVIKDKEKLLQHISDPEKKLIMRQVMDQIESVLKYKTETSTDFLDPYEVKLAQSILHNIDEVNYTAFGGHKCAERKLIFIYHYFLEDSNFESISVLKIDNNLKYTHRDILGAILNLGIDRKKTGDIIYNDKYFNIFVKREVADFIYYNLNKVKRENVKVLEIDLEDVLVPIDNFSEKKLISTSMRLDLIISSAIGVSRSKVQDIIKSGDVKVSFKVELKPFTVLSEGDILSIRKFGRLYISEIQGMTRKNKFIVKVKIPK